MSAAEPSGLPRLVLRLSDLSQRRETPFELVPDGQGRDALARSLGIPGVRKLRFAGRLFPEGGRDWVLEAQLGATVVQDCVATLEPVTTRLEEQVVRRYLADMPEFEPGEIEMPEDDTAEPLPATLDIGAVMREALALALPPFPRSDAAPPADLAVTEEGKQPMTDEDAKPFAGLAGLRRRLEDDGDGTGNGNSGQP